MAFPDLFVPKWQHSEARERAKAVAKMEDESLLTVITKIDASETVRSLAQRRLDKLTEEDHDSGFFLKFSAPITVI